MYSLITIAFALTVTWYIFKFAKKKWYEAEVDDAKKTDETDI